VLGVALGKQREKLQGMQQLQVGGAPLLHDVVAAAVVVVATAAATLS
jgi:hypothetical protein